MYVNGFNDSNYPNYRRVYTLTSTFPYEKTFQFCFNGRNLPVGYFQQKTWGYFQHSVLSSIGDWSLSLNATTGCFWSDRVSKNFKGSGSPVQVSIMLFNGPTDHGNNLAIDNVTVVEIIPQEAAIFSVTTAVPMLNNYTISVRGSSGPAGVYCIDYWYLYVGGRLVQSGIASPSDGTEISFKGVPMGTNVSIKIVRKCNCRLDAFWST